jgi:hypothetical protein
VSDQLIDMTRLHPLFVPTCWGSLGAAVVAIAIIIFT